MIHAVVMKKRHDVFVQWEHDPSDPVCAWDATDVDKVKSHIHNWTERGAPGFPTCNDEEGNVVEKDEDMCKACVGVHEDQNKVLVGKEVLDNL